MYFYKKAGIHQVAGIHHLRRIKSLTEEIMGRLKCIFVLFPLIAFCNSNEPNVVISSPAKPEIGQSYSNLTSGAATDLNGRPLQSLTASLTIGKGGPILLQDTNLINHLAHLNRERIPKRIILSKGAGAHGYFQVTDDITNYTRADLFSKVGSRTSVFVRFSTAELGSSADTGFGPRGFATKFYTNDGNWDLVGSSLGVFPIRDPILFPSLLRSRNPNPRSHLQDPSSFWDFTSLRPETTHHTIQLYSDLGIPDGYQHMNGYGVHTFKLVNDRGAAVYCKFHWRTQQGIRNLTQERATELAGTDPNYSLGKLYSAIERGNFPAWRMYIQVMTFEEAAKWRWSPFDTTKLWPESEFPLIPVGRLVLNRNPADYFTETESVGFNPGNLVPGIEQSPDPMLNARSFSYSDAQRYRLGVNFQKLAINRPHVPVNSFERDGLCAGVDNNGNGQPNYFPNGVSSFGVDPRAAESVFHVTGDVVREDTGDEDNFSQAKVFWDGLDAEQRKRLVANLAFDLKNVSQPQVLARSLAIFRRVDAGFASSVETKLHEFLLK